MKLLKIYILNCTSSCEPQIFCIKHGAGEDLAALKEKIFLRLPLLKTSSCEPQIYWYDLENDRISIRFDDDLRLFLEESAIRKLFFDYGDTNKMPRKRPLSDDEWSETSKRIRRRMQEIDLSESSMDTDDLNDQVAEQPILPDSSVSSEEPIPSTSQENVEILSVEIIQPADENNQVDENKSQESQNEESNIENETPQDTEDSQVVVIKRKTSESNRIVISDSSDNEEEEEELPRNRRYSDGNYSYSYSFVGGNNGNFESRNSFDDDFRRYSRNSNHRQFRSQFRQQHAENMARMYQNAQNVVRNAENIRDNAMRNIRSSANLFPQMLSTFQSHFRPLFNPSTFTSQQQFSRTYRR